MEEWCKEYGQLAEASEEGLGSKGAVVPIMMMMMNKQKLRHAAIKREKDKRVTPRK